MADDEEFEDDRGEIDSQIGLMDDMSKWDAEHPEEAKAADRAFAKDMVDLVGGDAAQVIHEIHEPIVDMFDEQPQEVAVQQSAQQQIDAIKSDGCLGKPFGQRCRYHNGDEAGNTALVKLYEAAQGSKV